MGVISPLEYQNKFSGTKIITLDDGLEFEIRKLTPLDLLEGGIKPDDQAAFLKKILVRGVVNPLLSDGDKENCLNVKSIIDPHFTRLVNEIMVFSNINGQGGNKSFLSQGG